MFFPILPTSTSANKAYDEKLPEEQEGVLSWMLQKRNDWGKLVGSTGRRLDGFFASDEAIERSNDSFVKIALIGSQYSGERSYLEPKFKFRLDLPTLKERLKIIIESEPEEIQDLEEKNRANIEDDDKVKDTAVGAIQLKSKPSHSWNASTSVGVDFQLPADPFWRAKGNYTWDIDDRWDLYLRESIYYFHIDGWGENTQLIFERDHSSFVFRTKTEAKYNHNRRRMTFAQVFSVLKEISDKRAIHYRVGVLAQNKPERQTTSYFTNATYRRKLYSSWLFYELTPELLFPRNDNFNLQPSITARIELVFSEHE